ncbi:MAG: DUF2141 domain-containing protein [Cyclobacteriaceae bacterium]
MITILKWVDKYLALVIMLLVTGVSQSVFAQNNELVVEVKNINESKGVIYVALYDSDEKYLKKAAFSLSAKATQGSIQLIFTDLPFGEYAISAIHDANENKELDKNFFGIPIEGFGFLDGEMGVFGPPSFNKVKVVWKGGDKKFEVPLKYF